MRILDEILKQGRLIFSGVFSISIGLTHEENGKEKESKIESNI